MANPQIVNYLKQGLNKGFSEKQLKRKLFESGWLKSQVNDALKQIHGKSSKRQKTLVEKNQHKTNNTLLYVIGGALLVVIIVLVILIATATPKISEEDLDAGTTTNIKKGKTTKFSLDEQKHKITVKSVQDDKVTVEIRSAPIEVELTIGEAKKVNINNDDYYDLKLKAQSTEGDNVEIYMEKITEPVCSPSWTCTQWSLCEDGTQSRNCTDLNNCGVEEGKPEIEKECCMENWTCTNWTECINGTQTRNCTDENNCGTNEGKPSITQECETDVLENCSELNGYLCNSSEICNGTELNSSDDAVCCNESCVLDNTENLCSEGYYYCNKSEYCNTSLENGPGEPVCCSEECISSIEYIGTPVLKDNWNDSMSSFKLSVSNCEEGYSIERKGYMINIPFPNGINVTAHSFHKIVGSTGENCTVYSNYTYYNMNYSKQMWDYLLQHGRSYENISQSLEEKTINESTYIGANATCEYPIDYLQEKIDNWSEGNYSLSFSTSGETSFKKFNCKGNSFAPVF